MALVTNAHVTMQKHDEPKEHVIIANLMATSEQPELSVTEIEELGAGWIAEEALAISVACFLTDLTPREQLLLAVNHSGDSDSTGSILGNLIGAAKGHRAIPSEWC